jgi:hypothetical protein
MSAFTNNSEMVLAIEGARGPPEGKKRNLFIPFFKRYYLHIKRGQNESPTNNQSRIQSPTA